MYSNHGTIQRGYATTFPLYVVACSALGLKSFRSASVSGGSESCPAAAYLRTSPPVVWKTSGPAFCWRIAMSNFWSVSGPNGPPWIVIETFGVRSFQPFTAPSEVIVSAVWLPGV